MVVVVYSVTDDDLAKVRARTMAKRKAQYRERMMHKSLVSLLSLHEISLHISLNPNVDLCTFNRSWQIFSISNFKRISLHIQQGHGKYLEYDPKEFFMDPSKASGGLLKESRQNKTRIVICVSHKASKLCPYMNKCLTELAMQHPETKVCFVCGSPLLRVPKPRPWRTECIVA